MISCPHCQLQLDSIARADLSRQNGADLSPHYQPQLDSIAREDLSRHNGADLSPHYQLFL
ncbi:hypothetical protein [Microcoleus sp. CAWBG58]|uniref:hypothetical protein n=1 Tax=Microcoleus sp. CAWBG58 TaxID=2841651 RepID=UPI0025E52B2E|nr:hypothetical protein [Microcoleus sp. CAWBG58]